VPNIPSKLCGLADKNKKLLTEWKWFQTSILVYVLNTTSTKMIYIH
jgi:hypothetical protein